jgi:hypothetical protein
MRRINVDGSEMELSFTGASFPVSLLCRLLPCEVAANDMFRPIRSVFARSVVYPSPSEADNDD